MLNQQKIYCSLDIETTGFDPLKDEVLEVGFLLFEIEDSRFKILEEYTQVFKPSKEVPAKILGLTGITKTELDNAPLFAEHRDIIQSKLKDAVIVGHNIVFDIKFLESLGIKFSGETIDTLDLVQWLLPTHHSYNLENLMHFFGVSHKDAHRALADAKASLRVLEKLLGIYSGLSLKLKNNIQKLIQSKNFIWQSFLQFEFPKTIFQLKHAEAKKDLEKNSKLNWKSLKNKQIYCIPFGLNLPGEAFLALNKTKKKTLLVVSRKQEVLKLANECAVEPVFDQEDCFDKERFESFLDKPELSSDETKFALKVLVWQEQNSQSENLLELNLSFFGGQFKSLINGKTFKEPEGKILCTDHKTFLRLSKQEKFTKRFVAICGLSEFENALTFGIGFRVSFGGFVYILKSYYNPENLTSGEVYKEPVEELLKATDMFFGLTMALFSKQESSFNNLKITDDFLNSQEYKKVQKASETFLEKIKIYNRVLNSEKLEDFAENLEQFFLEEKNTVKWVEVSEKTCVFQSAPIDICPLFSELVNKFSDLIFVDNLQSVNVHKYFTLRFGLEKFKIEKLVESLEIPKLQDLFSKKQKSICYVNNLNNQGLLEVVESKHLPATILFASQLLVKEFYEQNYQTLKEFAFLLAQSASGGSNKMLNNFSIHENSLLLATDKFILKFISGNTTSVLKEHLEVKTLVMSRLPFEQFTHPYQEAVSAQFENAFMDYALPRALINFHKLLEFFYTKKLNKMYITDIKMQKEYGKYFVEYLRDLNCFEIKS